jgi:predicted RNA-binding Zn-ribbon protein involved in translation (DUF1610 family)
MSFFGGRSRAQRDHVYATLRSLGPTTVDGLAAALSWSVRRTDRVLRDAQGRPEGAALRYDRVAGTVAWNLPAAPLAAPAPSARAAPMTAAAAAPTLPKSWGASPRCPSCQIALEPTGTGGLFCSHCGRLAPAAASSRVAPAPSLAPVPPVRSPPTGPAPKAPDVSERRAQEMFAAWVTAQPIPCPKCRTPLRHRGVASYGCPACGAQIAFEKTKGVPSSTGSVASVPSGPSGPSGPTL